MRTAVRIAVVDDDGSALRSLSSLLRAAGYEVLESCKGAEGLELIRREQPEVALLDVMLLDMSGFEVCRRIKEQTGLEDTFVVLMSGTATRGGRTALGVDEWADAYMLKSPDGEEFLARIRTFVRLQATTAALRASERNYRELAENIREVFWISDPAKNQMLYISPGYEEVWGRTCDSLYASPRNWLEAIHPDDRDRVLGAALTKQVAGEYHEVYRIRRPDGTLRWIEDRAFPIRNESGDVARIAGIADDITERKYTEMRSQAISEMRHRLSLTQSREEVAEIIFEVGSEFFGWEAGYVTLCISGQDRMIPLLTVDMVGNERRRFAPVSALSEPSQLMRRVMRQGAELMNPAKAEAAGLKLVPFGNVDRRAASMMFAPIHANGAVIGLISVQSYSAGAYSQEDLLLVQSLADISGGAFHRLEVNSALRVAEARYRGIFEHATEGIFQTTQDGRYISANPALARMFGYQSPEELIDRVSNIEHQTFVSRGTANELKALLEVQDSVIGFEAERYRKDRSKLWTSINVVKIRDTDNRLLYYEGTVQDITKRKRAEKESLAMSRLGYGLNIATTAQQAAQEVFEIALELFGWDAGYVELYSKAEDKIIPVLAMDTVEGKRVSVTPPGDDVPSPLMRLVMSKGAQLFQGTLPSSGTPELVAFGDTGRRSASRMFAAIRAGAEFFGILSIQSYTPAAYGTNDLALLQTMADYCGDTFRRIQATEALTRAELKYRSIFEHATEGIFQTTPDGHILAANPALARMFGYESAEEMMRSVVNIGQQMYVRPETRAEFKQALEKQNFVQEFEAEGYRKDGMRIWVSMSARVVSDEEGRALYYEGTAHDITERKRSEEQLRKLSRAVEQSPAIVIITDLKGDIEHVNSKFTEITGYTLDEVRGRNPRLLKSGWTPSEEYRLMWETITSGHEWRGEFHNRKKDGTLYWEAASISPIFDSWGRITHFVSVKEDVTERKRMEKKLVAFTNLGHRLSSASGVEEAAQIILAIAEDLFGWDSGFVHLYSEAAEKIQRVLTMDTIAGRRIKTAPSERAAEPSPMMRLVMSKGPQLINRAKEGEAPMPLFPFGNPARQSASLMYAPIRTGGGVVGIMSIQSYATHAYAEADLQLLQVMADHCGDALERIRVAEALREAEAVLRESERKLRLISENATDAIFAFDMARRPVYGNPAVAWLTGYTFAEIQERGFINWIHPDDQQQMLKLWEDLYAGKGYSEVEFRLITKGGQMKWCSSTWGPLFDESGRQIGAQGRERDVTQRKQLETEILEISTTERRRMGHELHDGLGQYLAGISFRAKALEQQLSIAGVSQSEEAKELVTLMGQAISQTRNLARGMAPVDVEASGLAAALQNLAAETSRLFKSSCQVICEEPDLQVDAQIGLELYRITQEAIHNALEHGEAERIDIRLSVENQSLTLQVIDDGKGFEVNDGASTGMGLRVMGYRARSIGGNLKVTSKKGEGTEVSCVVPMMGKNGKKAEGSGT